MPNVRALGRRLSCLVAGFFDGSPLPGILEEAGFEVVHRLEPKETLKALDTDLWQVVFLSDSLGTPVLQSVIERSAHGEPPTPVVVVGTTNGEDAGALAMKLGAADFVAPPFSKDALDARLRRWLADPPPSQAGASPPTLPELGLAGESAAMARLQANLARISRYKTEVLVVGERGSGKEHVARALVAMGPRAGQPFLPLYCATLDRDLLEAELFGHESASAGQDSERGLLELANGGTLFIDEIGELDLATQSRLLRVLERGELRRTGGGRIAIDLNVIAATRTDLAQAVAGKRFREDLFQRLRVATVVVPPLRERREDIPALAEALIADFNQRNRGSLRGLTPQALERLAAHDWPGNIRELKNVLESAAVMASRDVLDASDLPPLGPSGEAPQGPSSDDTLTIPAMATLSDVERILISEHLRRARTKADAAKSLGMGLRTLYTKIDKFQLADLTRRNGKPRSGRG
jgi:DNA-binding NtrC family response regulator